jgi:hypothetical protein
LSGARGPVDNRAVSVRPPRVLAVLAAFALLLVAPALSQGAAVQFGSSLTPGPVAGFGCEAEPVLINSPNWGDYGLVPNTKSADCTWRQAGVWGSETDPRASSVPSDGRIVRAEVLSGANPAPLRISVLRQLGTGGFAGQCCFFVSETAPIPLTPNAVTTIPLDIAVERNTLKGILAVDLMGISAATGAGSLPLRVVGPSNSLTIPIGNPMAGAFYPRVGSIPNDSGGGRREEGVPGLEVLVRWTFCASGDASCQPAGPAVAPVAPPAGPAAIIAPTLARKLAQVKENNAFVQLLCGADAPCKGQLELVSNGGALASGRAPKRVVYGSAHYKLAAGAKKSVAVTLNRRGRKLLRKNSRATVTLRTLPKGGAATTAKITLARAASGRSTKSSPAT